MKNLTKTELFLSLLAIFSIVGNANNTLNFLERFTGTINMKDWIKFIIDFASACTPFIFVYICYLVSRMQRSHDQLLKSRDSDNLRRDSDNTIHNQNMEYIREELITLKVFNQLFIQKEASLVNILPSGYVNTVDDRIKKIRLDAKSKLEIVFKKTKTNEQLDQMLDRALAIYEDQPIVKTTQQDK